MPPQITSSVTSELSAVNAMLAAIGEAPVTTVEGSVARDVSMALDTLRDSTRRLCAQPWRFNTRFNFVHAPSTNANGKTTFNALATWTDVRAARTPQNARLDLVVTEIGGVNVLYDRVSQTHEFPAATFPTLTLDLMLLVDFATLPEVARQYVVSRSTRVFTARMANDQRAAAVESADEIADMRRLKQQQSPDRNYNVFNSADMLGIMQHRRRDGGW
jgi:hypothetical protein